MSSFKINIEPTSNLSIVKFVADQFLTTSRSYEFKNIDEAKESPLAQQLFYLPFVKTVYIAQNFIAIEKFSIVAWEDVQEEVASQIENYLNSGKPVVEQNNSDKKVPVTVYAESTPNPSVLKFVANKSLTDRNYEFKNIGEARYAPLAQTLFKFPFVKEVFISENYISVSKFEMVDWQEVTSELRELIRSYLEAGKPIFKDEILQQPNQEKEKVVTNPEEVSGISREIVQILNEYVQPAVASDGGHIAFQSYNEETKTVQVLLQGACSGCPSSTMTLKSGIETMLREMLNDKQMNVEAING